MEEHSLLSTAVCCPHSIFAVHPDNEEVGVWGALYQLEMSVCEELVRFYWICWRHGFSLDAFGSGIVDLGLSF